MATYGVDEAKNRVEVYNKSETDAKIAGKLVIFSVALPTTTVPAGTTKSVTVNADVVYGVGDQSDMIIHSKFLNSEDVISNALVGVDLGSQKQGLRSIEIISTGFRFNFVNEGTGSVDFVGGTIRILVFRPSA